MFERKNQNVLSAHYHEVVDHKGSNSDSVGGNGSSEEEDFITLARVDHDLPDDSPVPYHPALALSKKSKKQGFGKNIDKSSEHEDDNPLKGILPASATAVPAFAASDHFLDSHLSKRALRIGTSKKAMLKFKGAPQKLMFDEEGDAHEVYNIQKVDESIGKEGWKMKGQEYMDELKDKLEEDNKRDREETRERRREKKREKKEKEKLVSSPSNLWRGNT
jgi:ATP-dependent RNA helicase DDX10/DBP4